MKKAIRVVVRTRPTGAFSDRLQLHEDGRGLTVRDLVTNRNAEEVANGANGQFRFDRVLHNASQDAVFSETAAPIVSSAMTGINGTVFAYGMTGAGKTFTVLGSTANFALRGIVPRAINQIFKEIAEHPENAVTVRISCLELYNEGMFDLLSTLPEAEPGAELAIVNDASAAGGLAVRGLTCPIAQTEEEALNLIFEGDSNRAVSKHALNKNSSRSHVIFTVYLETRSRVQSVENIVRSKINFVDLAGSERVKKTGSEGLLLKEATHINKSLAFLEQTVMMLSTMQRDHVPFRQSKLTNILKDSLGGNSQTVMIGNIMPENEHMEDTISTLKFSTRVMKVTTEPMVNVDTDPSMLLKRYEREIKDLKAELAMHDTLSNRTKVLYEPYTEDQRHDLSNTVKAFLDDKTEDIEVINLRHIKELFRMFRIFYKNAESKALEKVATGALTLNLPGGGIPGGPLTGGTTARGLTTGASSTEVGDLDAAHGMSIGMAPASSRPEVKKGPGAKDQQGAAQPAGAGAGAAASSVKGRGIKKPNAKEEPPKEEPPPAPVVPVVVEPPNKSDSFNHFKKNEKIGQSLNEELLKNKTLHREKKTLHRQKTIEINDIKEKISDLQSFVDAKKSADESQAGNWNPNSSYGSMSGMQSRGNNYNNTSSMSRGGGAQGPDVIDEEYYHAIVELKGHKTKYRQLFNEIEELRNDIELIERLINQGRENLVTEFDKWYNDQYGSVLPAGSSSSTSQQQQQQRPGSAAGAGPQARGIKGPSPLPGGIKDEEFNELDDNEKFEYLEKQKLSTMYGNNDSYAFYMAKRKAHNTQIMMKSGSGSGVTVGKTDSASNMSKKKRELLHQRSLFQKL